MKLKADILASNRNCASFNMKAKSKASRSTLALCIKSEKAKENEKKAPVNASLLLQTKENLSGVRYDLKESNLEAVFAKFLNEGKATLRFKKPPMDLCVSKADPLELKAFLGVVKKVVSGEEVSQSWVSSVSSSALKPAKLSQLEKPKTKLLIGNKKDYPITSGFPHTLETLKAVGINLKAFDRRILKLRHLRTLDLSDNAVANLLSDQELQSATFRNLNDFCLARNGLESLTPRSLMTPLFANLCSLDLSENKLKILPPQICTVENLVHLKIDGNELTQLPQSLSRLRDLNTLTASRNKLRFLPGGFFSRRRKLTVLDLSENGGLLEEQERTLFDRLDFPSLTDLALKKCLKLKEKIGFKEEELPFSIRRTLDMREKCPCGDICFENRVVMFLRRNIERIAESYSMTEGCDAAIFAVTLCSAKCRDRYGENPFAI